MKLEEKINKNWEIFTKIQNYYGEPIPSWHHYWLYWLLRMSVGYFLSARLSKKRLNGARVNIKKETAKINNPYRVLTTFNHFGNVWDFDFSIWWHQRARYQFEIYQPEDIAPITVAELRPNIRINDKFIDNSVDRFRELLGSQNRNITPYVITTMMTLKPTKKQTVNAFSKYLDEMGFFGPMQQPKSFFTFEKSKIRESTIRNALLVLFKKFELGTNDLVKIAAEANVLQGAMADYLSSGRDPKKMQSVESMRSGTSRQIKQAILLAENAARSFFPSLKNYGFVEYNLSAYKILYDYNCSSTELYELDEDKIFGYIERLRKEPFDLTMHLPHRSDSTLPIPKLIQPPL